MSTKRRSVTELNTRRPAQRLRDDQIRRHFQKKPVRFIAHITVNDVDGYRRYGREFFPVPKP